MQEHPSRQPQSQPFPTYPQYPQPPQGWQPGQYPPVPPQPPQRKKRKTWADLTTVEKIGGYVVVAALILSCIIGCCAIGLGGAVRGNANQGQTNNQQQPTHTPAKPACPITATLPALGGTECDFTAKYGVPISTDMYRRTYDVVGKDGTAIAGVRAHVQIRLNEDDGKQPGHVEYIEITPDTSGATWTQAAYAAFLLIYLPSDAKYLKVHTTNDGSSELVYKSASLARMFPADSFTNTDTGNAVAPGTFISGQLVSNSNNIIYMLGM